MKIYVLSEKELKELGVKDFSKLKKINDLNLFTGSEILDLMSCIDGDLELTQKQYDKTFEKVYEKIYNRIPIENVAEKLYEILEEIYKEDFQKKK